MIMQDLDTRAAIQDGRLSIDGDVAEIRSVFPQVDDVERATATIS